MARNLTQAIIAFLKENSEEQFTAREISQRLLEHGNIEEIPIILQDDYEKKSKTREFQSRYLLHIYGRLHNLIKKNKVERIETAGVLKYSHIIPQEQKEKLEKKLKQTKKQLRKNYIKSFRSI